MKKENFNNLVNSAISKIGSELSASEMNEVMGGHAIFGLIACCIGSIQSAEDFKLQSTDNLTVQSTDNLSRIASSNLSEMICLK